MTVLNFPKRPKNIDAALETTRQYLQVNKEKMGLSDAMVDELPRELEAVLMRIQGAPRKEQGATTLKIILELLIRLQLEG